MLCTRLFRGSSLRPFIKLTTTMSQKSLLSFFQKKTVDDLTRSPLQENTASEKPSKSPSNVSEVKKGSKKDTVKQKSTRKIQNVANNEESSNKSVKKRKRSEEREVTKKANKKPTCEIVPSSNASENIDTVESVNLNKNDDASKTEPPTLVVKNENDDVSKTESPTPVVINENYDASKTEPQTPILKNENDDTSKTETSTPIMKNETDDTSKTETSTPTVKKTLSFLSSKKSTKKSKSKTPAKKNVGVSPEGTKFTKKCKVDGGDQSPDTDQIKGSNMDDNVAENDTEKSESATKSEKPKIAAFLNTKKEDDSDIMSYNPAKERYNPIEDACWKQDQRVPYLALAKTLQKIEETSARLKIISILSNYFRSVIALNQEDLLPSIYLCLNQLGPAYETQELGIADTYLMKAIAQCTGRSLAHIKADAAEIGDLGIVAEQSRSNQRIMFRPSSLTVRFVFSQLTEIASISGHSAINKKIDKIQGLFVSCRDCEARFVIRSLAGKLRIGLAEQSVIQALALACTTTPPSDQYPPKILDASKKLSSDEFKKKADEELLILKSTYSECPNYNLIVPILLEKGLRALPEHCKITPGIPVKPMLAQPSKGVQEVLQRFEGMKFTCEWKYDGERAQIHILENGSIKLYSRNMEDNTSKYPDIIADISQFIKPQVKSCILDAEAVAWDQEQQKIMPFQILSTRKRKAADINEIKVRVCVYLFDLLYLNGESFIQKPLIERRNALEENFQILDGKFVFVNSIDTNTMEEVEEFLEESVKGNCEGLMIKTLDVEATYEIAKRSRNWLKLKKDYLDGCGDTLDLVVIGGYIGKGKRTGQYGGFLLACYDADNEEYQTICKIGTGFSDEALAKHYESLKQLVIPKAKSYYRFDTSHEPDFWFDAVQVWEVKCADLSLSPIYYSAIGLVDSERGISLRFPRFLRIREDKSAEQATSSNQVADLYRNQDQIKNQTTVEKFNEEDF